MRSKSSKKIVSIVLAFFIVIGAYAGFTVATSAVDYYEWLGDFGGLDYVSLGNSSAAVSGFNGAVPPVNLVIPAVATFNGEDYTVTRIAERAFIGTDITSLTLPDTLKSIGEEAFMATNITTLSIPDSVEAVGDRAFANSPRLSTATIGDGVTEISDGMFSRCTSLSSVHIPDTVTTIGAEAFDRCTNLNGISISGFVTDIGDRAFAECEALSTLVLQEGIQTIGADAFTGVNIAALDIPDSVTDIGANAFKDCLRLGGAILGSGLRQIGDGAFEGCTSLTGLQLGGSVYSIGDRAFYRSRLTALNLPNTLTSVGTEAFAYNNLGSLAIPAGLASIGSGAFAFNQSLYSITVDAANAHYSSANGALYTKSGDTLMLASSGLTAFDIPGTVTKIDTAAFAGCGTLAAVTIANSVRDIGAFAFYQTSLSSVAIPDSVISIGEFAFSRTPLTGIVLGNYVETIAARAFSETNVRRIDIPASVDDIGYLAFYECSSLNEIYFFGAVPSQLGDQDRDVFKGCASGLVLYCPSGEASWDGFIYPYVSEIRRFGTGQYYAVSVETQGSGSATASVSSARSGETVTLTATEVQPDYIFSRWDVVSGTGVTISNPLEPVTTFIMPGNDVTVKAFFSYYTYSDSGSGSGGGGGISGPAPTAAASYITVSDAQASSAGKKAGEAARSAGLPTATVVMKNLGLVSKSALNAMQKAAGMPTLLQADSMSADGKRVEARIVLNPELAGTALNLSASVTNSTATATKSLFGKWYQNKLEVISLGQKGSFGQPAEVAAKLDLSKMDISKLVLYSYDKATNNYVQVTNPNIRIDQNGYIHFTTTLAGEIIISEGPLTAK